MKGAAARRERNRMEMRRNVLDAAQKMVAEGGFEHLTIRGIARELGYSPGAIYEYFENKEAILCSLYFDGSGGFVDSIETAWTELPPDADAITAFLRMGEVFRRYALRNRELYRFTFNVMKQPSEWGEAAESGMPLSLDRVVQATMRGMTEGDLIEANPADVAISLWVTAHGFVSLEVSDHFNYLLDHNVIATQTDDPVDALYQVVVCAAIRGWATEQGRAKLPS